MSGMRSKSALAMRLARCARLQALTVTLSWTSSARIRSSIFLQLTSVRDLLSAARACQKIRGLWCTMRASLPSILPVISSIMASNRNQIERAVDAVLRTRKRRVAILGLCFKVGTDDLRESPQVELAERLIGKGIEIKVYDPTLNHAILMGANRDYIQNVLPHLDELLVDTLEEAVQGCDFVVVGNNAAEFSGLAALLDQDQHLLDLAGIANRGELGERYHGINW